VTWILHERPHPNDLALRASLLAEERHGAARQRPVSVFDVEDLLPVDARAQAAAPHLEAQVVGDVEVPREIGLGEHRLAVERLYEPGLAAPGRSSA
jgi:hypothetical protein